MQSGAGKRRVVLVISGVLLLSLLACAESTTAIVPSHSAAAAAVPAITSTALRPTVEQAQVDAYLHAIEAEHAQAAIQATLTVAYGVQTATAIALEHTATAESMQATAQAQAAQATATARAWGVTVTAAAQQATATAQAEARQEQMTAQAFAAQSTVTAEAWELTVAAVAAEQAATDALRAERLEQERLETQRQRLVYPVKAYGPWAVLATLVILLVWGGYRFIRAYEMRLRAVPRDARGDAPVMVLQQGGQTVIYDPDRAFGPATVIDGDVQQPTLTTPELQERTTARDQAVDLASRGLPQPRQGSTTQAQRLLQRVGTGGAASGPVRVIPPARVRPWLAEVRPQALRQALTVDGEILDER